MVASIDRSSLKSAINEEFCSSIVRQISINESWRVFEEQLLDHTGRKYACRNKIKEKVRLNKYLSTRLPIYPLANDVNLSPICIFFQQKLAFKVDIFGSLRIDMLAAFCICEVSGV